ncbi:MAG: hypothetical protein GY856_02095, partial [bacterium]|nr:hypothetical protein [bacterium]
RHALDDVEGNVSDTYRSDDDDEDEGAEGDDADSDGDDDAAEAVLAGARRALWSVGAVLGTDQSRQAPPLDDDDRMSEADLCAALDDLINAAEGGRRPGSDSTGSTAGTSTSGETGASTSSLIQRVKDRHGATDPGEDPACGPPPPPPPPRRPSAGPREEEEYDFDEWELRPSPAQLSPLAVADGVLGSDDGPSWLWGEAPAVPSTRLPDQASVCLLDGHRFYGVDLNSLLPGEIPTQTAVDLLLSDVARLCAGLPVRILNVGTIAALTQVHALDQDVQEMLASCDLSQEQAIMFVCNDACTVPATGIHFAAMVWDRTRWVYTDSLADPRLCWPAARRAAKKLTHFLDAPGNAVRHTVVDRVATPRQTGPECAF